ncbi:sporulation protein YunB [Pelosinus sp. sgz500959]|uniref:sporulation protein YunB n=1 Tax=Pelosinus sp. sgz500959 TaxID=3242472 RepID=UPI00366E0682
MRFLVKERRNITSLTMIIIVCFSCLIAILWVIESHLKPTLLAIAETKATLIATQSINRVISERVNVSVDSQKLVNVTLDSRGRVVLIQPNTMEFNKIAADTTIRVQDILKEIGEEKIKIPMGQILGSQLFASVGPDITVTVIPMGTVSVKVIDKFQQAGINQTRHMIYLIATTQIRIVVPLVSKSVSVDTQVLIAEYVVVGEVPSTYVQFPFPLPNGLNGGENNSEEIN